MVTDRERKNLFGIKANVLILIVMEDGHWPKMQEYKQNLLES